MIKEMFLGSVSNYVTHHVPCSVLIVYKTGNTSIRDGEVSLSSLSVNYDFPPSQVEQEFTSSTPGKPTFIKRKFVAKSIFQLSKNLNL